MIARSDVMMLLLQVCPSFAGRWRAHVESEYVDGHEPLLYLDLGVFADHVVNLYVQGQTEELRPAFDMIERLHKEGDEYVREAATIGLLEGIQNAISHRGDLDAETLMPFLGPETAKWWNELNAFWKGQRRYIGEMLEDPLSEHGH